MTKSKLNEVKSLLDAMSDNERKQVFGYLRSQFQIHPVESKLMATAETILEAIDRAPDLSLRGVKGLIAEAAFAIEIVPKLTKWKAVEVNGDVPYDFQLSDSAGQVKVQVKMQRTRERMPLRSEDHRRTWGPGYFVVETQKTRSGEDSKGESTRPYRFGEFDILAVSLGPSTRKWSDFIFTVGNWLIPQEHNKNLISTYQPVSPVTTSEWTMDFDQAASWFRSDRKYTISIPKRQE